MSRKQKCEIPILGILDIDGSLVRSIYHDSNFGEMLKNPALLDKTLAELQPLPWVLDSGILTRMTVYIAITGRVARQQELTAEWFEKKLGLSRVELIMVSYETKERYITNKKKYIRETIADWIMRYGRDAKIIIIDDDIDILNFLREEFTVPNIQIVSVDESGIPHFS